MDAGTNYPADRPARAGYPTPTREAPEATAAGEEIHKLRTMARENGEALESRARRLDEQAADLRDAAARWFELADPRGVQVPGPHVGR